MPVYVYKKMTANPSLQHHLIDVDDTNPLKYRWWNELENIV